MSKKYELNGNQVLRDGVVVATIGEDGAVNCTEEGAKYRSWIVNFLKNPAEEEDDGEDDADQTGTGAGSGENGAASAPNQPGSSEPPAANTTATQTPQPPPAPAAPAATATRPGTVRELIAAMQPHIEEVCPAMTPWEGDRTPAVLAWLQRHDEVRITILKSEA